MSQTNMRLEDETLKMIRSLAHSWGGIKPLTNTDVVRECVKRAHQQETKRKEKRA
jgi:hypothetical protein